MASELELISLPDEIIQEIFSKIDEHEVIRNCTLICKRFQILIFGSPKIMRQILILFDFKAKLEEIVSFLTKFGGGIKNLNSNLSELDLLSMLKLTSNLEELTCSSDGNEQGEIILPYLKRLNISGGFKIFIDTPNLEKLIISYYKDKESEDVTEFIERQKNLKELLIYRHECKSNISQFPTKDISNQCEFKLTKFFNQCRYCGHNENFQKFLECQIKSIEEINLFGVKSLEILNIIFKNGHKLDKLFLSSSSSFKPLSFKSISHSLTSVKHFSIDYIISNEFDEIFKKFPNLVSLRFIELYNVIGCIPQLETLQIENYDCSKLLNLELPNLKSLSINQLHDHGYGNLEKFCQNAPNIETVCLNLRYAKKDLCFIKFFKNLKKLEVVSRDFPFIWILIDYSENKVYWSNVSIEDLQPYRDAYPKFEFIKRNFSRNKFFF